MGVPWGQRGVVAPGALGTAWCDGTRGPGPSACHSSWALSPGLGCRPGTNPAPLGPLTRRLGLLAWYGLRAPARALCHGHHLAPSPQRRPQDRAASALWAGGDTGTVTPSGAPPETSRALGDTKQGTGLSLWEDFGKRHQRGEKRTPFAPQQHPVCGWGLSALHLFQ